MSGKGDRGKNNGKRREDEEKRMRLKERLIEMEEMC